MTTSAAASTDAALVQGVLREVARRIVGQEYMVERLLISLLTGGHVLLEGVPGLAKTLTVRTLAETVRTSFARIQFTPDLLPADVVGTQIFDQPTGEFRVKHGPIFANIILADEINRAPAKVQAALLEAMQEKQVTIGGTTYRLAEPFLVLATQNPIEQEGTYPLPEAQMDRFMLKVVVGYPSESEERVILDRMSTTRPNFELNSVVTPEEILRMQELVNQVYVDDQIKNYVIKLVLSTRRGEKLLPELQRMVRCGASPRATINLTLAARAHALLQGQAFVTPDDVKAIAFDVLRHRILLTYEAEAEEVTTDSLVQTILSKVPVP